MSTLLYGSTFEVVQQFQFFLQCCLEYFLFAQILLTNGSWVWPKVHQCNGSKGALLIWKNRIVWIKCANSGKSQNWSLFKFFLQPKTIYLAVLSNFQHLPLMKFLSALLKSCKRFNFSSDVVWNIVCLLRYRWQILLGVFSVCSDIVDKLELNLAKSAPMQWIKGRAFIWKNFLNKMHKF